MEQVAQEWRGPENSAEQVTFQVSWKPSPLSSASRAIKNTFQNQTAERTVPVETYVMRFLFLSVLHTVMLMLKVVVPEWNIPGVGGKDFPIWHVDP